MNEFFGAYIFVSICVCICNLCVLLFFISNQAAGLVPNVHADMSAIEIIRMLTPPFWSATMVSPLFHIPSIHFADIDCCYSRNRDHLLWLHTQRRGTFIRRRRIDDRLVDVAESIQSRASELREGKRPLLSHPDYVRSSCRDCKFNVPAGR
jgi:hypothetical protein